MLSDHKWHYTALEIQCHKVIKTIQVKRLLLTTHVQSPNTSSSLRDLPTNRYKQCNSKEYQPTHSIFYDQYKYVPGRYELSKLAKK